MLDVSIQVGTMLCFAAVRLLLLLLLLSRLLGLACAGMLVTLTGILCSAQ
jgi:hypothetical protein